MCIYVCTDDVDDDFEEEFGDTGEGSEVCKYVFIHIFVYIYYVILLK
jgi:hypothetical protein